MKLAKRWESLLSALLVAAPSLPLEAKKPMGFRLLISCAKANLAA